MPGQIDNYMTSDPPQIAVHIVTHNNTGTIKSCLDALQAQTIGFDVCIVDNASHDGTVERIRALGYPVIENTVNTGYSAAHNQAIRCTENPYILTLNPDVRLMPDFLEQMLASFEANPNVGAQAGLLLRVNSLDENPICVDSCGLTMQANHRQKLRYEGCAVEDVPQTPEMIFGPDGAAAMYRRTMLKGIATDGEIFDEDFFLQKEDIDLCWRIIYAGWDALFVPAARAHHIRGFRPGQRKPVDRMTRQYAVRNRYLLLMKHYRTTLFLRQIIPLLAYDLAILIYLILFEQSSLGALWDALRLSRRMFYKRRIIREKQLVPDTALLRWFRHSNPC